MWHSLSLDKWKLLKALLHLVTIRSCHEDRARDCGWSPEAVCKCVFKEGGGGVRARIYTFPLSDPLQLIQSIRQYHLARSIKCVFTCEASPDLHLAAPPGVDSAMSGYDDNQGWGDDVGHGYHKSSLRKDQIENLADRDDISEEEKRKRKRKLEEEIAAGVVGGGILGYAGYHHHEKKEGEEGEQKHHHFGL